MINWFLGGFIIVATMVIIVRSVNKLRNGKTMCGCEGCDPVKCSRISDDL
ncbi:MAG: hypothetical protein N2489_01845 [Clostridia bacterium]|nr:hypothetical protein [Clostridia bacterium]